MVIQLLKRSSGNYVRNSGLPLAIAGSRVRNKPCQRPNPPKRRPIQPKQPFFTVFRPMGLHFGSCTASSRGVTATNRGELRHARVRHAGDTPQEGFAWRKTPIATGVERTSGPGEPGRSAREQQGAAIARQLAPGLRQSTTLFAQQEPRRAASGQNSPSTSRTAPLPVQNSPSTPEMAQFGAFSACRESFIPFSPPRSPAGRVLYRTRGRVAASHDSTPGPTGVEGGGRDWSRQISHAIQKHK